MKTLVLLSLSSLALAGAGCDPSSDASASLDAGTPREALAQLERETGQKWRVRLHPDLQTPAFLEGRTAPMAATAADAERAGRAFLRAHRALFGMRAPDEELAPAEAETDELGMTHARFRQLKDKVPVWGGELAMHFAGDGALIRLHGRYEPVDAVSSTPALSADEARSTAVLDARGAWPDVDANAFTTRAPVLWVLPRTGTTARLAWRVETSVRDDAQPMELETFVDAIDGSVLVRNNTIDFLDGSGVGVFGDRKSLAITERRGRYWLEDASRGDQKTYSVGASGRLPGTGVSSADRTRWDEVGTAPGAAVDAHAHVAAAYDYYLKAHGRAGWDGHATGPHASVHFGSNYANAFFNGKQLVFGDGDETMSAPSAALDVVAHEYTHGVVAQTARLGNRGENGALNEGIADVFGCFISYGAVPGGDWQIGESIYHPNGRKHALRDLAHPHATDNPATLGETVVTDDDQGGVHVNSTVVSHAAYLMTEGGTQGDHRVRALGRAAAQRIWYRAMAHYLTSRAGFADAADATVGAAKDFGHGEESTVRDAWVAVGVVTE
jgi:Zn-dependent metalloprotease